MASTPQKRPTPRKDKLEKKPSKKQSIDLKKLIPAVNRLKPQDTGAIHQSRFRSATQEEAPQEQTKRVRASVQKPAKSDQVTQATQSRSGRHVISAHAPASNGRARTQSEALDKLQPRVPSNYQPRRAAQRVQQQPEATSRTQGGPPASARNRGVASRAKGKAPHQNAVTAPKLWTKDAPTSFGSSVKAASGNVAGAAAFAVKHKKQIMAILVVLVVLFGVDSLLTDNKVYAGVHVGSVDLSGLTQEQAENKLEEVYGTKVQAGNVLIYAGEEGKRAVESGEVQVMPEEQLSVEEVAENTKYWEVTSQQLGIVAPKTSWSEKALAVGRSDGGVFARLKAQLFGTQIDADLTFDEAALEDLGKKIDSTLGKTRVDWNISISDGVAEVTEGYDGFMIDRDVLRSSVQSCILDTPTGSGEFVAVAENAPIRINKRMAEKVRDQVNKAIADGAVITHNGTSWEPNASELGEMITTQIVKVGNGWSLVPTIKSDSSKATLLSHIKGATNQPSIAVSIQVEDGNPTVYPSNSGIIPDVAAGIDMLDTALFGGEGKEAQEGAKESDGKGVSVSFGDTEAPDAMSFDDALAYGFIEKISGYTTEYTNGKGTEARVNNIHVAASELNNSVCKANGGTWSFNNIAGESTEEKGFQAAGSIFAGEYQDSIGGGVCQVATTVFNAVYDSGLPIPTRHNHTLYIASYPEGRDAAVAYPDIDLVWKNDTSSDIIMRTSYTDHSVTVELYGVSPHYKVKTDVGNWQEGQKYKTTVRIDEDLPTGSISVETSGTNGSKITVIRSVYSSLGQLVREDSFESNYEPKNEVIVTGPNTPVDVTSNA